MPGPSQITGYALLSLILEENLQVVAEEGIPLVLGHALYVKMIVYPYFIFFISFVFGQYAFFVHR